MTSNEELVKYLTVCDPEDVQALLGLLRSRLSPTSRKLAAEYASAGTVPAAGTDERVELSRQLVNLVGWYGANSIAYTWRKIFQGSGGKAYLGVLRDVVRLLNHQLPRKHREKLPVATGVPELEQKTVELLLALQFHDKKTEEIVQILEESGLEKEVAEDAARRYGPGLASVGLPILTKVLGKKTVMTIVQQMLVAIVGRFIGKEAASQMAKRVAVKIAQKTLTRLINWVGWVLLASDIVMFAAAPARRITLKAIPFLALSRVRMRLAAENNGKQPAPG